MSTEKRDGVGPDRTAKPKFRYYDLKRNWRKVEPHLSNGFLNHVLVTEFNKFTFGRWGKTFKRGQYPRDYESCDWSVGHKGPEPRFWRYVKHAACHWIVNFTLVLAQLVEPTRQWRIITSDRHSTVWDGKDMLFDFNFQAMGISADECFELANEKNGADVPAYPVRALRGRCHLSLQKRRGGAGAMECACRSLRGLQAGVASREDEDC